MYKKLVRELSKKVQKINEAEQFVFISEQSSQFFVKFSTKYLQHRLKKKGRKFKSRLNSHSNLTTLGNLTKSIIVVEQNFPIPTIVVQGGVAQQLSKGTKCGFRLHTGTLQTLCIKDASSFTIGRNHFLKSILKFMKLSSSYMSCKI